jgi:hypothetical protein
MVDTCTAEKDSGATEDTTITLCCVGWLETRVWLCICFASLYVMQSRVWLHASHCCQISQSSAATRRVACAYREQQEGRVYRPVAGMSWSAWNDVQWPTYTILAMMRTEAMLARIGSVNAWDCIMNLRCIYLSNDRLVPLRSCPNW